MRKINILYWICTIMVSLPLASGSVIVLLTPDAGDPVIRLGYPGYLVPFLAVARLLGIAVLLIPKYPRLKEWAYAGITFDLVGALYSHIAFGDSFSNCVFILLPGLFLTASYVLYHKKIALAGA